MRSWLLCRTVLSCNAARILVLATEIVHIKACFAILRHVELLPLAYLGTEKRDLLVY